MVLFESIEAILVQFGYVAIFGIVFAESGLFFGFFLPGDSLLFTAGLLASNGLFDIKILIAGVVICAIAGDQVGYWTGHKFGKRFFNKPGSLFFDPAHIEEAQAFYEKHGKKAIVIARFVPVIRTFAPIVAGIASMDYKTFVTYNILGGILWGTSLILAGFILGHAFPDADKYITYVVLAIIVISTIPIVMEFLKRLKKNRAKKHLQQ